MAVALHFASLVHQCRREAKETQERGEAAVALSSEQGFPLWVAGRTIQQGWALVEQGRGKGILRMRQGLSA